jgi:hypothetical protein
MGKNKRKDENATLADIPESLIGAEREETKKFSEDEIINRLKSYRAVDDIVASVFGFLEGNTSPSNRKIIHESMKDIKDDYPILMSDFIFTTDDVFSYSPLLERVLGRLQISNTIEMINPSGTFYQIAPRVKDDLRKRASKLFTEDEQRQLKEMARMFEELAMPKEKENS